MWQPQQQQQAMQQQFQQGAGAAPGEVGQARVVRIDGCKHEVVGPIIRGEYQLSELNHGKPAYKKDGGANQSTTVMIYFWDERDGVASSGWWIGPAIGGNMVWGHHPNRTSATPPTSGWQAPHSAPADPSMTLLPAGAGAPQQAFNGQAQQAQMQAQLQQQQMQQMLQMRQQQMQQMQQQQQQQQQLGQQQNQAAQKAQWEAKMQQHRAASEQQQALKVQQMEQLKVEQQAAMAIRKVLMKLKTVGPETWEAVVGEIQQLVSTELAKCGSQAANIKTECEKALLAAKEKMEQMIELRRKSEERLQELNKQREEARENAKKLLTQLNEMVEEAESEQKSLAEAIKTLSERKDITTQAAVERALSKVETEGESVSEKASAALEFFRGKQNEMSVAPAPKKPEDKKEDGAAADEKPKEPELPSLQVLSRRSFAAKAAVDKEISSLKALKVKFQRRVEANDVLKKQKTLFDKYDKNKDKFLDKKEIVTFAKSEYKFQMPDDALAQIDEVIVAGDGKGVKFEYFARLLTAVGIAREKDKDMKRRQARLDREAELADEKKKIQAESDEVQSVIKESTDFVNELLNQTRVLPKDCQDMTAVKMVERSDELEAQARTGEEKIKAAQAKTEEFGKGEVDKDLERFVQSERNRLCGQAKSLDSLISNAKTAIAHFKTQATKKDEAEVRGIADKAMARLKAFQASEKLSPADVFKKIAGDGEHFDKDQYVAFMMQAPKAGDTDDADISKESFGRAFAALDDEKVGSVTAEALVAQLRNVMKVVHDVALTAQRSIEDATSLRIVQVGEAVEVLEGPVEEGELKRIKAKCLSDAAEGWLSLAGSKGTVFLTEGGNTFKVVKETILTECFEIDSTKESGKKDSTRKLKPGELLEARVWGQKQEESGLTRMKVKAKQDGLVGWVTTVGNTGIKFVEMA